MTGAFSRDDIFLLHEYNKTTCEALLLPQYAKADRCRGCDKFNEQQIFDIGFDKERVFSISQDILTRANDMPQTIVTDRFRDVCIHNSIKGVLFLPCGQRETGGDLYLLWPDHRSQCCEPVEKWSRGNLLKLGEPAFSTCHLCGRPEQIVGHPHKSKLVLPNEMTISIPSIATEMKHGIDFRFFCSDTVRKIFKAEKIKGCYFSEMERMERLMTHNQAVRAELEAKKTNE